VLARAQADMASARQDVVAQIEVGGFPEAVCRIILAGMASVGAFERRSLRLARLLALLPTSPSARVPANLDWVRLLKEQARVTAVAPVEALNALQRILPDMDRRERALAVSAAVMMIEPTLANPRSEIIGFLMETWGADATRVMDLACKLTSSLSVNDAPGARA